MIPRSHLITLNQVMIDILKTTNSPIVRVVCNVGPTVRMHRAAAMHQSHHTRLSHLANTMHLSHLLCWLDGGAGDRLYKFALLLVDTINLQGHGYYLLSFQ